MDLYSIFRETLPSVKDFDGKIEYCQRCGTWISHTKIDKLDGRTYSVIKEKEKKKKIKYGYTNPYGLPFSLCAECHAKIEKGEFVKNKDINLITEDIYLKTYRLGEARKEKIYDYAEEYRKNIGKGNSSV